MNTRIVALSIFAMSAFLIVGCGDDSGPTGATPNQGRSAVPSGAFGIGGGAGQSTTSELTSVGEILADPNRFMGQGVRLQGRAIEQIDDVRVLFTDGTGEIRLQFEPGAPVPSLNEGVLVAGTAAAGMEGVAVKIDVTSWETLPPFSCDDIPDIRARFTDPGYAFGNVVGYYLAFRGVPEGNKVVQITWDEHNPSGSVETIEVGPGVPIEDGLFALEGVVAHEYENVQKTETKNVRANLIIAGRDGLCSRVREVTVSPGSGPGFAGGGTISVSVDQGDTISSGSRFSVRAKVDNKATSAAAVAVLFQTPNHATIHSATGSGCDVLNNDLVECDLGKVQPGESLTRVVEYSAPLVTSPLRLDGYVALVSGGFKPVAEYQVSVEP